MPAIDEPSKSTRFAIEALRRCRGTSSMGATMIAIRNFEVADQDRARELIEAGLGEHFGRVDPSSNPDLDDIQATYVVPGGRFFVAEIDGTVVGTLGLVFRDEAAEVVRVSTQPEVRRRGVASALLAHAIVRARAAGFVQIVVRTQPEWRDSMAFYLSQGFIEFGHDAVDVHLRLDVGLGRLLDAPAQADSAPER